MARTIRLPLVTVVTPSLNQGRFIRETIESVLAQSYPRIEYLVMDGGSTDDTPSILRGYGDRLTWVSRPDRGQADAVNVGWKGARGEVLAYLNSDDTYLPAAVERAVEALCANPDTPGLYGEGFHVDEAGRIIERYPSEPFSLERLAETCFICQPTVFLRHEAVRRVGYLDPALRYCMDYDLWIRLGRIAPLVFIPEYLAKSRLHASTKTLGQRADAHREILEMVRRHFGYVPPTWAYAYANAVAGPGVPRRDLGLAVRLIAITLAAFLKYNWMVPPWRWRGWIRWLRKGLQHQGSRSSW